MLQSPIHNVIVSLFKNINIVLVYRLRTQNLRFVAPMPEQIGAITMHFSKVSEKCIVGVLICFGMGATNFIFKAPTDLSR